MKSQYYEINMLVVQKEYDPDHSAICREANKAREGSMKLFLDL